MWLHCPNKWKKYKGKNMTDEQKKIDRFYKNKKWISFRKRIFERDQHVCQRCFALYGIYTYEHLECHHIKKIALHWDERLDEANAVTLCKTCHRQVDITCKDGTLDFEFEAKPVEYEIHFY